MRTYFLYSCAAFICFLMFSGCKQQHNAVASESAVLGEVVSQDQHKEQLWKKRAASGMVIHVYGNEPFWSLEVYADSMLFSTPDFRRPLVLMGPFDIVQAPHLVLRGTHEGGEGILVLAEGPCVDNMSDNTHSYQAQLDLNDFVSGTTMKLGGCGNWVANKVEKGKQ